MGHVSLGPVHIGKHPNDFTAKDRLAGKQVSNAGALLCCLWHGIPRLLQNLRRNASMINRAAKSVLRSPAIAANLPGIIIRPSFVRIGQLTGSIPGAAGQLPSLQKPLAPANRGGFRWQELRLYRFLATVWS